MKMSDITVVKREVMGVLIPYGSEITLMPGTEVLVTQALGGSFTLNVNGNLVRIEGKDGDAIGKEPVLTPVEKAKKAKKDKKKDNQKKDLTALDEELMWAQLKTCYDPEIPVNIVDLGLIYEISKSQLEDGTYHLGVQMTLTAPGCGMGPVISAEVEKKLAELPGVSRVDVVLVFDPPWSSDMMSEEAKLELGVL